MAGLQTFKVAKARGLFTHPNQLTLPEGALVTANHCVIRRENVVECRRGFSILTNNTGQKNTHKLYEYNGYIYQHWDDGAGNYQLSFLNGGLAGSWVTFASFFPPADVNNFKVRFAEANKNLYLSTANGIYRFDTAGSNAAPPLAGGVKAPGIDTVLSQNNVAIGSLVRSGGALVTATLVGTNPFYQGQTILMNSAGEGNFPNGVKTVNSVSGLQFTYLEAGANSTSTAQQTFVPAVLVGSGSAVADQKQVAYRVVIGFKDANNNVVLGSPSPRYLVRNNTGTYGYSAGVTQNVTQRVLLPKANATASTNLTTSYFVQLYRSSNSPDLATEPLEDLALVFERYLTSTDITNGWLDITDVAPDSARGAALYTNPSQNGILSSNEPPPFCRDMVAWQRSMVLASTFSRQRMNLQILGVDGSNGIQAGDAITIGGVAFVAHSALTGATNEYLLDLDSSKSTAQQIESTALSLCAAINRHSGNTTVYAYYASDPDGFPGKILLESRTAGPSVGLIQPFVGNGSKTNCFDPPLPVNAGSSTAQSIADDWPNAVFFTPPDLPESFPLLNYVRVGSPLRQILKVMPLRDSLYVFKENEGVFRITGTPGTGNAGSLRVDLVDPTVWCLSPETVAPLGNRVFLLSNQGVVAISGAGVQVVSRPIETTLIDQSYVKGSLTWIRQHGFAYGYDSEREYHLWLSTTPADIQPTQCLVYNYLTDAWTNWPAMARSCGVLAYSVDRIYLSENNPAGSCNLYVENKSRNNADFNDAGGAIPHEVKWAPLTAGEPGKLKQWIEAIMSCEDGLTPSSVTATFSTEQPTTPASTAVAVTSLGAGALRVGVPQNHQRCARLSLDVQTSVLNTPLAIAALTLKYRTYGTAVSR